MSSSRLTAVISEFSSTILNPFDLQQLLHRLTVHAAELTGSQGAGIMLAGRRDGRLGFAAASDERVIEMELVQDRVEAGACYQAFLDNQLMALENLEGIDRWPAYEQRAAQLGLRAVLAVPMNAWGETIGVVNIYRDAPGPWSPDEVEAAQIVTAMGSGYVLHANQIRAQHDLVDQLQEALEGRDLIGQAKGVLMNRDGVDADTAFDHLRRNAQTQNINLRDVARKVVTAEPARDDRTVAPGFAPAATTPTARGADLTVDLRDTPADGTAAAVGSSRPADKGVPGGSLSARTRDRTAESRDEAAAARDEAAHLRDQMADRRDAESHVREQTAEPSDGPDPKEVGSYDQARGTREIAATRHRCAVDQDRTADRLDDVAADHDRQADVRDEVAEQRDREAQTLERSQDSVTVADTRSRAAAATARRHAAADRRASEQDRRRAADERTAAGVDRDASAAERRASASDRRHAGQDRAGSATDRAEASKELTAASLDALTGTYSRGAGMAELDRDFARARRSGEPMTIAFVDVDDLKGTNDRDGHPAGDRLIRQVAEVLTEHTRSHDVIIRYGGDEFVCALVGLTRADAAERLAVVTAALAKASEHGSITVGLAELEPNESLRSLIRRADADLYHQRRQR